jgi:hypothetical protein
MEDDFSSLPAETDQFGGLFFLRLQNVVSQCLNWPFSKRFRRGENVWIVEFAGAMMRRC